MVSAQQMTFQAEKHTYTNSNRLLLKIELLNQKCQAQGSVTCLAGPDKRLHGPISTHPSGWHISALPQDPHSGGAAPSTQSSCSHPADKASKDARACGKGIWPMVTYLTNMVPLGTQKTPHSSPLSAMTTGTWQVNTFSFSTYRGDNIEMPSTHRASIASRLSSVTENRIPGICRQF